MGQFPYVASRQAKFDELCPLLADLAHVDGDAFERMAHGVPPGRGGVGRQPGQLGHEIVHNLRTTGYTGKLYAINPSATGRVSSKTLALVKLRMLKLSSHFIGQG